MSPKQFFALLAFFLSAPAIRFSGVSAQPTPATADLFDAAAEYVSNAKENAMNATDEDKLCFYKYFKQATVGDCNTDQPWFFQPEPRAKWDAWNEVKGMAQEDAKIAYVELLDKLAPGWRD